MIYLDNAATAPVIPEAVEAFIAAAGDEYANPSSSHLPGRNAKKLLELSREKLAAKLPPNREIIFTSGGTEANNIAVFGAAKLNSKRVGKHIVTTMMEHDAVRLPSNELEKQGYEVTRLKPDRQGRVSIEQFDVAIRVDTALVSVMSVCNETGNIYPVTEVAELIKRRKLETLLHCDAVQAFGKIQIPPADLISLSAHKIGGIKGVGALAINTKRLRPSNFPPIVYGGGQELGVRSGTEPLQLIAAFAAAAEHLQPFTHECKNRLISGLAEIEGAEVLGSPEAPHVVALAIPGIPAEVLMNYLDAKEIFVSKGSACKRGQASHAWDAMGLHAKLGSSAIRVSFGRNSTVNEVDVLLTELQNAIRELYRK
jgi:cysteine desulfurase